MPKRKGLSQDVIDKWPEVFKDVEVKAIPLEYLESVQVTFNNGKVWEITINRNASNTMLNKDVEKSLNDMFKTYDSSIKNVDFKVDTDRVKEDVQKRTKQFLKKKK
jgi:hypothetical protein